MYINCKQHRTPFAVFACIFEVVVGYTPPSTGKHIDEVVRLAAKRLSERDAALLVCLDDANYLHESCPFSSAHQDGAFAIQFANGAIFAGCHHASCGGGAQRWPELRGLYEKKVRKSGGKAPREKEQEEKTTSPPPADEHRERALTILKTGDPLAFILDTFNKSHVGGRTVAECLAMSLASQSVESMGVEIFAVRQLQSALGLSYYQTRRLLNGYVSRGTLYSGLLEKCPAISLYDATVTEDGEYGVTIRRREQYFTFDAEVYRAWSNRASVWLDDDPDDGDGNPHGCTFAPGLHQNSGKSANEEDNHNREDSGIGDICTEIGTDQSSHLHPLPGTESMSAGAGDPTSGVCETRSGANMPDISKNIGPIAEPTASCGSPGCNVGCNAGAKVQTTAPVNPSDYIPLPVEKDEPCHACGRRPTSSIKRGGEKKYLCYDCLKAAKRSRVQPLPGVLDHRTFERMNVDLGRCDICREKRAVYRSREAKVCEGCYARLVREWNGRAGVR